MASRSISVDVAAANSKLAQSLRRREEEEALVQVGKRKTRSTDVRHDGSTGKKSKASTWSLRPDFSYASPMVDRPRTTAGATSFHFSSSSVSKEGRPTVDGKPLATSSGGARSPGSDHASYIERDGAAERSLGAEHAGYLERDGAVETGLPAAANEAGGIGRDPSERTSEELDAEEAATLGPVDADGRFPSVFSNISDDQFERQEYWRAVHRSERDPKTHSLVLDPSVAPVWWDAVASSPRLPEDFRDHALQVLEEHAQWSARQAAKPTKAPFVGTPFKGDSEACGRVLEAASDMPGWNAVDPPVEFKSGPGGRVQYRFVAELPHELGPEDRALIVQNFCDHLGSFSKGPDGEARGMMYTAVIHAPDSRNDRRNFHLHVIAHDRPAEWLPEYGRWDFEVEEFFDHKREQRVRHPYRQDKIPEVSRQLNPDGREWHPHFNNGIAGSRFIPHLRAEFARINNAVLEARGIERRLDPRTYKDMGIDRTPTEHLGNKAASLESIGVPTIVGKLNAIKIWDDSRRAIDANAKAVEQRLATEQKAVRALVQDAQLDQPGHPDLKPLRALVVERETIIKDVVDDRRLLMAFDNLEAKAKSRAVRTRQTCLQILTDIRMGRADKGTVSVERHVRARFDEAQGWIERIDRMLKPDRPKIAEAAADVIAREDRLKAIDSFMAPMRAAFENATTQGRLQRDRQRAASQVATARAKARMDAEARARDNTVRGAAASVQDMPKGASMPASATVRGSSAPRRPSGSATTPSPGAIAGRASGTLEPAPAVRAPGAATTPVTASPQATPSVTAGPAAAPVPAIKEQTDAVRRFEFARGYLDQVSRLTFGPRQPGPELRRTLQSVGALSDVRHISRMPMVQDRQGPDLLLLATLKELGGRDRVRRDRLRRTGQPDREVQGEGLRTSAPNTLASPAIEGEPITDPALDPVGLPARTDAPKGLAPLRNVASPGRVAEPAGRPVDLPKGDGRKTTAQPTLFDVEIVQVPVKPSTAEVEYQAWNDLINRISRDRVRIVRGNPSMGEERYSVPSLDGDDRKLLRTPRLAKRTAARLDAVESRITWLVRWISTVGRDPSKLVINGRKVNRAAMPRSVARLFTNWLGEARITAALVAESDRRDAMAATRANETSRPAAAPSVPAPASENAARERTRGPTDNEVTPQTEDEGYTLEQLAEFARRQGRHGL